MPIPPEPPLFGNPSFNAANQFGHALGFQPGGQSAGIDPARQYLAGTPPGVFPAIPDIESLGVILGYCAGELGTPAKRPVRRLRGAAREAAYRAGGGGDTGEDLANVGMEYSRLYSSLQLTEYVEIADIDVVFFVYLFQLSPDSYPWGGTVVWVRPGADLVRGTTRLAPQEFTGGSIAGSGGWGGRGEWTSLGRGEWTSLGRGEWTSIGGEWTSIGGEWTSIGR